MKWNNILRRHPLPKYPKTGSRCLVVIRKDFVTEACYIGNSETKKNYITNKWFFRDEKWNGEFVEMWTYLPDFTIYRHNDDFPTPNQIKHILSMVGR